MKNYDPKDESCHDGDIYEDFIDERPNEDEYDGIIDDSFEY